MHKLLFVCLGNICRSPTAHAVMRTKARAQKLPLYIDSAGTSASHRGHPPDNRSQQVALAAGYDCTGLASRPVKDTDFAYYDLILAMDKDNLQELRHRCPKPYQHKLQLFLHAHTDYPAVAEVPDPYYGGIRGFEQVLMLIEQGCDAILQRYYR
ncbi:low molecular weight protein-tyrosine-phosphatase [Arsukibacterium sp.]|uniref:low molecular weight protein-tyrosine-phosphatase n=1 Tax=Arsukibacterium sp. TaxID=1977258 RepID=UPI002FDB1CE2